LDFRIQIGEKRIFPPQILGKIVFQII